MERDITSNIHSVYDAACEQLSAATGALNRALRAADEASKVCAKAYDEYDAASRAHDDAKHALLTAYSGALTAANEKVKAAEATLDAAIANTGADDYLRNTYLKAKAWSMACDERDATIRALDAVKRMLHARAENTTGNE